jgi:hypothetical protein
MKYRNGEHISKALKHIEKNIQLNSKDPVVQGGFTQIPNFILEKPDLSLGAKVTYAMFLRYAWHNDFVYPGLDRLAQALGVTPGRISQFTKELSGCGLIEITRRGLGKTNLYKINFVVQKKPKQKTRL